MFGLDTVLGLASFFGIKVTMGFVAGLLIGWNVLPQPTWVSRLWERAMVRVRRLWGSLFS